MPNTPRGFIYKKTVTPCFGCEERYVGCHSQCRKYKEWKDQEVERRKETANSYRGERAIEDFYIRQRTKVKRKRG